MIWIKHWTFEPNRLSLLDFAPKDIKIEVEFATFYEVINLICTRRFSCRYMNISARLAAIILKRLRSLPANLLLCAPPATVPMWKN